MINDLKILTADEIRKHLVELPGWVYQDNKISKQFKFNSFNQALEFVNRLAPFCNQIDHHPDIQIQYKNILFELSRFDIGGKVTPRDFVVAQKIEELFKALQTPS